MHYRRDKDFISMFDAKTGRYARTGRFVDGKDSGEDPFMASFPELLDVGIMGHCRHGHSGLCMKAGIECYQDGLHAQRPNMKLEDFRMIVRQCRGQTYQFALGGCGDPDQHEQFREILETCKRGGIVPNFTTSGMGMNAQLACLCGEYCGAVAVSWYRSFYTYRAIGLLLEAGVKTNIHYVLSNRTLEEACRRLREKDFPKGVNAVIFLLHKPVGLGSEENVIRRENGRFQDFLKLACSGEFPFQIGFDSCSVPALLSFSELLDPDSLDTCEGARWSAYITPDMKMLPCSFDNQEQRWAVDLKTYSIEEAWHSRVFEEFRDHFRSACPDCPQRGSCFGGCPICPEIILCGEKRRMERTAV